MKLLVVIPPVPSIDGRPKYPWYLREENHSSPDSTPMPPHFAPTMVGRVRQEFGKGLQVMVRDGLLHSFSLDELRHEVIEWGADAVLLMIGMDILEHDAYFADLPCPVIAQMCPVTLDPVDAIALYGLKIPYFLYGGESEQSLAAALKELSVSGEIVTAPGIVINRDGAVAKTIFPDPSDLQTFALPAYDLFPMWEYLARQKQLEKRPEYWNSALLKTMKGCLFKCVFCTCSAAGQQARYKSVEQVVGEIEYLRNNYGIDRFVIIDSEFGVNLPRAKEICRQLIEKKMSVRYLVNNRVDLVDEELVGLMKESGCELMRFGIESADPKVQRKIEKKIDLVRAAQSIRITRAAGIPVNLFFLVGLPGEDGETLRMNADFIVNNQADSYSMGRVFLIPNTVLYRQIKSEGKLLVSDWQLYRENEMYQFSHEYYHDLRQLKHAERHLLNMINRKRLTSYKMGRMNERIYMFLSSFGVFSFFVKEKFPRIHRVCKAFFKKALQA